MVLDGDSATPSAPVVISGDRKIAIAGLRARAMQVAGGLRAIGVGEGDTIALFLRNDFAFFEASLGAGLVGAYPVPVNWHATADEAGYVLRDSAAKLLVVHRDLAGQIASAVPPGLPVLIVETPPEIRAAYGPGSTDEKLADALDWETWLGASRPVDDPVQATRAAVIYTSGTTGRPKGVKRGAQSAQAQPAGWAEFGFDRAQPVTALINGPMYHSAPNAYGAAALQVGANLVLQARFDAEEMLMLIERYRITHMHIVPTMFVRLLKLPAEVRTRYDLSSLRFVIHGAAPCPVEVKRAMIEWWGPVIYEYYGSTETGLATWHDSADALRKPGTVGRPLPTAQIRIVDEHGVECGPNEPGEIYIRAAGLPDFTYIGADDKRAEVGLGDYVTVGDIGWLDDESFLFLGDRKRDMIISGGVNIYPAEIEGALLELPGVKDCAVFGIPDEDFGEAVCAYIQPMAADAPDPRDILHALGQKLSRFKLPKVIEFVADLPREDSGKIFKRKLREPYWAGRAGLPGAGR
jgi:long-chain acyl-CoA synthetase